jgi:GxxExxY protein
MKNIILKEESYNIIGACINVHKLLGCGFLEPVYQEALEHELKLCKIPFEREKRLAIKYRDIMLSKYSIADFICYNKIILELKALSDITEKHQSQVINYLKANNMQLGIIINFGSLSLDYKRIPNKYYSINS